MPPNMNSDAGTTPTTTSAVAVPSSNEEALNDIPAQSLVAHVGAPPPSQKQTLSITQADEANPALRAAIHWFSGMKKTNRRILETNGRESHWRRGSKSHPSSHPW